MGFSHSIVFPETRWAEVLAMLQMSRGWTGSDTSYRRRRSVQAPWSMTTELAPPPWQATSSGGGEGIGTGGLFAGVGDGLTCATGDGLGDGLGIGEWRRDPLATPTLHALTNTTRATSPASRPINTQTSSGGEPLRGHPLSPSGERGRERGLNWHQR